MFSRIQDSSLPDLECCCGRSFTQTNSFSLHQRTCKKSKTRLFSALSAAKDNWSRRKKARTAIQVDDVPAVNAMPQLETSISSSALRPRLGQGSLAVDAGQNTNTPSSSVDPTGFCRTHSPPTNKREAEVSPIISRYSGRFMALYRLNSWI